MARNVDMARLLIQFGANPHAKNSLGQTPTTLVDDVDRARAREELRDAFEGGRGADAARRAAAAQRMAAAAAEREALVAFERKLRGMTRGTAAAKTLTVLSKVVAESRRAAGGADGGRSRPRAGAGDRVADTGSSASGRPRSSPAATRGPANMVGSMVSDFVAGRPPRALGRPPTAAAAPSSTDYGHPFAVSVTRRRPVMPGTTPAAATVGATTHTTSPLRGSGGGGGVVDLYADSTQRHMRDFMALSRKAVAPMPAASGADRAASLRREPGGGFDATMLASGAAFDAFYSSDAPPPSDRRFDVWFKAHVSAGALT